MKQLIKRLIDRFGLQINLKKNLWYLDSFHLLQQLNKKKSPVIFDVGGLDGSTIIDFKKILPNATIHSFEPYPDSYNNLRKLTKVYNDVHAHQMALNDEDGNGVITKAELTRILKANHMASSEAEVARRLLRETKRLGAITS